MTAPVAKIFPQRHHVCAAIALPVPFARGRASLAAALALTRHEQSPGTLIPIDLDGLQTPAEQKPGTLIPHDLVGLQTPAVSAGGCDSEQSPGTLVPNVLDGLQPPADQQEVAARSTRQVP